MKLELEKFKKQRLAILIDDASSQSRAVLFAPAENMQADLINRMLLLTGGLLFVVLSPERSSAFVLSTMSRPRTLVGHARELEYDLKMCVSVEAREGVTTGISASDRAATVRVLGEQMPSPRKLVKPGHIFPIVAHAGGVLVHHALPDGALDIVKLSGFTDAAAILDIIGPDGALSTRREVEELAKRESLSIFSLSELTQYRLQNERLIERVAEAKLPTHVAGDLRSIIYKSTIHEGEHLALVKGNINSNEPILTRVQPEYTFADVFGGNHPPARQQLHESLRAIGEKGCGVLIYLRRPVRGQLQQQVLGQYPDKSPAVMREYGLGSQILRDLDVRKIELLTTSARDFSGVRAFGLEIVGQRSLFN